MSAGSAETFDREKIPLNRPFPPEEDDATVRLSAHRRRDRETNAAAAEIAEQLIFREN
jgi:hypothetical protein